MLAGSCLLTGCTPLRYVTQAAMGQTDLIDRSESLREVIANPRTAQRTRELLAEVPRIKAFGEAHGLRATRLSVTWSSEDALPCGS